MPRPDFQTSIHGRRFGLSFDSKLIVNDANAGLDRAVVVPQAVTRVSLTAAQMAGGFTTPVELVAAPGAGKALLVSRVDISLPAGTAFGGIAAGEDITIVYSGGTDPVVTDIETTGFLDSTAAEMRIARAIDVAGTYDLTALADTAIDYELLVGDITGGRATFFDVYYEIIDLTTFTL